MSEAIKATTVTADEQPVDEETDQKVRDAWWEGYVFALNGIIAGDEGVKNDLEEQKKITATQVEE